MRYYITPVRLSIIKKFTNKWWRRYGEKGTLFLYCWCKCKLVQVTTENSMEVH